MSILRLKACWDQLPFTMQMELIEGNARLPSDGHLLTREV